MILNTAFRILALSLVAVSAQAQCNIAEVSVDIACTPEALQRDLAAKGCTSITDDAIVRACEDAAFDFGEITDLHYQFDKSYMDGGAIWNDGRADEAAATESRVRKALKTVGSNSIINWPMYEALTEYVGPDQRPYMSNFNFTDGSCDLSTVMCCFIDDKDDREEVLDNSEVCTHDLRDSRRSNHINRGWAEFDNNANTYCTGFTFSPEDVDGTNRVKGNSLLDLSFRNTVENGLVKNIPGAPMCACIEQMPTVSTAHCRTTTVSNEALTYSVTDDKLEVKMIEASVTFDDCPTNDLLQHAMSTYDIDLSDHLVGKDGCEDSKDKIHNEKFWVPTQIRNNYAYISEDEWELVAGKGTTWFPVKDEDGNGVDLANYDAVFREKLGDDLPFVVRRYCESCLPSHRDIYYKRLTPLPPTEELNFIDLFLNNWFNTVSNTFHEDFELYSSKEDADNNENAWTYCNFNDGRVGFPRDCGPTSKINNQWNSYTRGIAGGRYNAFDHGFYVAK